MKRTPLKRRTPLAVRKGLRSHRPGETLRTYKPRIKPKVSQPNAQQRRWRELVRAMGSIISGRPAEIHHAEGRNAKHNGVEIGHWWILPLTPDEHRGPDGIHSHPQRKAREKQLFARLLYAVLDDHNGLPPECFPPRDVLDAIAEYHR